MEVEVVEVETAAAGGGDVDKTRPITVLSLCDGISCGQEAFRRLGRKVTYYGSEVKPHAIAVTQDRFSDTIQLGDVREVTYENGVLTAADGTTYDVTHFDFVLAGFPCQDFSVAGDGSGKGLDGEKSAVYFDCLRLLKATKP